MSQRAGWSWLIAHRMNKTLEHSCISVKAVFIDSGMQTENKMLASGRGEVYQDGEKA
jgi:hypothetical protein